MNKAIITGARGFAGSWLSAQLLNSGYEVIGLDLQAGPLVNSFIENSLNESNSLAQVKMIQNDLSDQKSLEAILEDVGDCTVFHLAGMAFIPDSWDSPLKTLEINTCCSLRILEAMNRVNWKGRFVYISSADVYGNVDSKDMPITEKTSLAPQNPYARSKLVSEQFGMFYRNDSRSIIIARPFNHTGPGQNKNFAIPAFVDRIQKAIQNKSGFIKVGDIDSVRDYLDVRDVARAYLSIAQNGQDGEIYNICSGIPISIRKVLDMIIQKSGSKIELQIDKELLRPEGASIRYGNPEKLGKLDWASQIPLEKTIADIWDQALT